MITADQEREFFKELDKCKDAYYFYTKYSNLPYLTEQQFEDMINKEQTRILDKSIFDIKLRVHNDRGAVV